MPPRQVTPHTLPINTGRMLSFRLFHYYAAISLAERFAAAEAYTPFQLAQALLRLSAVVLPALAIEAD